MASTKTKMGVAGLVGMAIGIVMGMVFETRDPGWLIQDVKIKGIIAETNTFGVSVLADGPKPPAPWWTRFEITLNSDVLDNLSPARNFESIVRLEFTNSDPFIIRNGENIALDQNDVLKVDFCIPETILNGVFMGNPVLLVLTINLDGVNNAIDVKNIDGTIRNSFKPYDTDDGATINGPTTGTDICDPEGPEKEEDPCDNL